MAQGIARNKIRDLVRSEGFDISRDESYEEYYEKYENEAIVPGICMSLYCDNIINVDAQERNGYCTDCDKDTVMSCLVLFGPGF